MSCYYCDVTGECHYEEINGVNATNLCIDDKGFCKCENEPVIDIHCDGYEED